MLTEMAYQFLTGQDKTTKEFEYCRNFGWCVGLSAEGGPVLTKKGILAVRDYRSEYK